LTGVTKSDHQKRTPRKAPRLKQPPSRLAVAPSGVLRAEGGARTTARPGNPLRHLYSTARWAETRARVFLRDLYTCQWPGCGRVGGRLVADHRVPHQGDERLFWDEANLQTLCKSPCHDKHKQLAEQSARRFAGVWN